MTEEGQTVKDKERAGRMKASSSLPPNGEDCGIRQGCADGGGLGEQRD